MSLILATGSNIGDRVSNLQLGLKELTHSFKVIAASSYFESEAVDYINQPAFLNQVIEFKTPDLTPQKCLDICLNIERKLGRIRTVDKGPRTIDIDIIFYDMLEVNSDQLTLPHPSWNQRSFVVYPLQQLPYFQTIKKFYKIPSDFEVEAYQFSPKDI